MPRVLRPYEPLPDTLHELLDIALEDVGAVEQMPDVRINMFVWHEPSRLSKKTECLACAAGSVIIRRTPVPLNRNVIPDHFDAHTRHRLYAIDRLRTGSVADAWNVVYSRNPDEVWSSDIPEEIHALDRVVPHYDVDLPGWWEAMIELHMDLRKAGI